jgi:hypothetical protein
MDVTINNTGNIRLRTAITDFAALFFVGMVPAASHLFNIPIYYIEPMRVMLVFALLFSSRWNAFALALALPLFSFLVSGHPMPLKMIIIMAELLLNAWLFLFFYRNAKMPFLSTFGSIIISKVFCYLMYMIFFSVAFLKAEAASAFLLAQLLLSVVMSSIVWLIVKRRSTITV